MNNKLHVTELALAMIHSFIGVMGGGLRVCVPSPA
jgi:hypothetical protein